MFLPVPEKLWIRSKFSQNGRTLIFTKGNQSDHHPRWLPTDACMETNDRLCMIQPVLPFYLQEMEQGRRMTKRCIGEGSDMGTALVDGCCCMLLLLCPNSRNSISRTNVEPRELYVAVLTTCGFSSISCWNLMVVLLPGSIFSKFLFNGIVLTFQEPITNDI